MINTLLVLVLLMDVIKWNIEFIEMFCFLSLSLSVCVCVCVCVCARACIHRVHVCKYFV